MSEIEPEIRERLIAEFRALLDTPQAEFLAEPDDPVDLHTLLSELAALKSEVRLEARQFKNGLDELRGVVSPLRETNERLLLELDHAREQLAAAGRQAERQILLEVLDLRDRIDAGFGSSAAHRPTLWARLFTRSEVRFARHLGEGLKLTLDRVDRLLDKYRVKPLEVLNQPLDPHCMNAVGTQSKPQQNDGMVVAEQRRGYLRDGELLRCAEVIVNKRKQ